MYFDQVVLRLSDALIQAFHKLENTVNVAEEVFRIPSQRSQGRVQLLVDLSNLVLKQPVLLLDCVGFQVIVEVDNLIQTVVVRPEVLKTVKEFCQPLWDLPLREILLEVLNLLKTF